MSGPMFQVTQGEWDEVHRLGRDPNESRSIQERLNAVLAERGTTKEAGYPKHVLYGVVVENLRVGDAVSVREDGSVVLVRKESP